MHNMFLGELRHHCMEIFRIGRVRPGPKTAAALHPPAEQEAQLKRVGRYLRELSADRLADMRKDYLLAVARYNQVFVPGRDPTRRVIAQALVEWVRAPLLYIARSFLTFLTFSSHRTPSIKVTKLRSGFHQHWTNLPITSPFLARQRRRTAVHDIAYSATQCVNDPARTSSMP